MRARVCGAEVGPRDYIGRGKMRPKLFFSIARAVILISRDVDHNILRVFFFDSREQTSPQLSVYAFQTSIVYGFVGRARLSFVRKRTSNVYRTARKDRVLRVGETAYDSRIANRSMLA